MGLFTPYKRADDSADAQQSAPASTAAAPATPGQPKKKSVPTPTRKQAEADRMERLHPTLSAAEQRKRDRATRNASREEQFRRVDDQPGRVLLRDFLDSRKGIAQWWMPIIMISLAAALAAMYLSPSVAVIATFFPYGALLILCLHVFVLWRQYKVLHAERLPNESLKGQLAYLINRMISLRRFRMPPPRVKPGDAI